MPVCVECGAETPRDEMRGAPDELRCPACAKKRYAPFLQPRVQRAGERKPVVTFAVIAIAVVATLAFWESRKSVAFALEDGHAIWDGEIWRFITAVFLHGNWIHLGFNLYCLWQIGPALETWMGHLLYGGFILVTAAGSSAAQFLTDGQGSIGFSGVIFAMFGLLFALRRYKDFAAVLMHSGNVQFVVFWFFLCIVLTYTKVWSIANTAHAAGAVLGWLIGCAVLWRRRMWSILGVCLFIAAIVAATQYMPWNGYYAWHRGAKSYAANNDEEALYWLEKANQSLPAEETKSLQPHLQWLRHEARRKANLAN